MSITKDMQTGGYYNQCRKANKKQVSGSLMFLYLFFAGKLIHE
jgi:hypothetical protein